LSTVKEDVTTELPWVVFWGVIRIRTAFAADANPTPSPTEFHWKVCPVPGFAEEARPLVPSPPGAAVAVWKEPPALVENSTAMVVAVPVESDKEYCTGMIPLCGPTGSVTETERPRTGGGAFPAGAERPQAGIRKAQAATEARDAAIRLHRNGGAWASRNFNLVIAPYSSTKNTY
jgi:hypothetical protein